MILSQARVDVGFYRKAVNRASCQPVVDEGGSVIDHVALLGDLIEGACLVVGYRVKRTQGRDNLIIHHHSDEENGSMTRAILPLCIY